MGENDPVTRGMCESHRDTCLKIRTLETQNMLLNLRAEFRAEMDALRQRVEKKFDDALRAAGYEDVGTDADTAVPADPHHHPVRRTEDIGWRRRALNWVFKNATWLLVGLLCLIAGARLDPYVTRMLETLVKAVELGMK